MLPASHPTTSLPPKTSGIYQIRNAIDEKIYVGSASDIAKRWRQHRSKLGKGKHHSRHLQSAWDRHGPESFAFEVLEIVPDAAGLMRAEQAWIDRLQPHDRSRGYNMRPRAESNRGIRLSPEHRAKLSEISRKNAAETGRKVSEANTGKKHSPEWTAKVAASLKGRAPSPQTKAAQIAACTGRRLTDEHKAKIAAAGRGRKLSPEAIEKRSAARRGRKFGPLSDETKAKLSEALKKRPLDPNSAAALAASVAAQRGVPKSAEVRAKISASMKEVMKTRTVHPNTIAGLRAANERRRVAALARKAENPESQQFLPFAN